jgi:hypothetical protein
MKKRRLVDTAAIHPRSCASRSARPCGSRPCSPQSERLGYDQPRRRRPNAHSPETEERERFAAEALTRSPDLLKILEPLEVVILFQPAFDSEFSQDRHHLSDRNPR